MGFGLFWSSACRARRAPAWLQQLRSRRRGATVTATAEVGFRLSLNQRLRSEVGSHEAAAAALAEMGVGLSLKQHVRNKAGSRTAAAVAVSTMRHATATAEMSCCLSWQQRVRSKAGSHGATAAALSLTRRCASAIEWPQAKVGASCASQSALACGCSGGAIDDGASRNGDGRYGLRAKPRAVRAESERARALLQRWRSRRRVTARRRWPRWASGHS